MDGVPDDARLFCTAAAAKRERRNGYDLSVLRRGGGRKQNALEKAKSYLEYSDMSDEELFDQLTSEYGEQFTAEEAQYAIDHLDD